MSDNRIEPVTPAMNPVPISPTGSPLFSPKVVPYLVAVGGVAYTLTQVLPAHTVAFKVAGGVVALLGLLGVASPGWRK